MQIVEETAELKDGHYQISLLFNNPESLVSDSRPRALQRVNCLKKKLVRDPKLYEDYMAFMENILAKGYARKVLPPSR